MCHCFCQDFLFLQKRVKTSCIFTYFKNMHEKRLVPKRKSILTFNLLINYWAFNSHNYRNSFYKIKFFDTVYATCRLMHALWIKLVYIMEYNIQFIKFFMLVNFSPFMMLSLFSKNWIKPTESYNRLCKLKNLKNEYLMHWNRYIFFLHCETLKHTRLLNCISFYW